MDRMRHPDVEHHLAQDPAVVDALGPDMRGQSRDTSFIPVDTRTVGDLPTILHFNSVSTTQGTCIRTTSSKPKTKNGTVKCTLGTVGAGNSATITIWETATKAGTVSDTASATATNLTPDTDDSATATTRVIGT